MAQHTCKKHGTHYGTCASCLKKREWRREDAYKKDLRQQIEQLQAENKKLKEEIQGLYEDIAGASI